MDKREITVKTPGYMVFLKTLCALLIFAGIAAYLMAETLVPLIAGLALLVVVMAMNFEYVISTVTLRSFKYTTNAVIYAIVIVLIVGLLNYIGSRQKKQWDMTVNKRYTLAEQTIKLLKGLKEDLNITMFYPDMEKPQFGELLKQYSYNTDKFRYDFADINKKPELAEKLGVTENRVTVLKYKDKIEKLYGFYGEPELTNAIIRVTRPGKKSIYFLNGHGEADNNQTNERGMSALTEGLTNFNFEVKRLNLLEKGEVPADCATLIVAGPQLDLIETEEAIISRYLDGGGHAFFMLDAKTSSGGSGCEKLMAKYGIVVGQNLIVDPNPVVRVSGNIGVGDWRMLPFALQYDQNHAVTKGSSTLLTFYPFARSINAAPNLPMGVTVTQLAYTSPNSFADSTYLTNPNIAFDPASDARGPVPVMACATKPMQGPSKAGTGENELVSDPDGKKGKEREMRLVVVGTSKIAQNRFITILGNGNMMSNIITYLAEEEDLIAIKPKTTAQTRLDMSQKNINDVFYITFVLLPGIIIFSGFTVWFYRNR